MFTTLLPSLRTAATGLRVLIILTLVLGLAYPALMLGVGRLMPAQADGSMLYHEGQPVGSALIGQNLSGPEWFRARPSASDQDAMSSGASNLAATSPELQGQIDERRARIAAENSVSPREVPADALTASGSGLDPDISPEYAHIQAQRIATARGLSEARVTDLIESLTQRRTLGFIGVPRVNVPTLNLRLAELRP